jgi:hypothetical protein
LPVSLCSDASVWLARQQAETKILAFLILVLTFYLFIAKWKVKASAAE